MTTDRTPWGAFVAATLVVALFVWVGVAQLEAPAAGTQTGFPAERAFETLARLLKEDQPHPVGSPENKIVRDRILGEFRDGGYEPQVQAALQCAPPDRFPGCTQVENVLAVKKGTGAGKALLITAHYDSVPAGPGAGDDGAGTAIIIEYARAIANRTVKNDVIFLITDGEEVGLRGALAFAERHPLIKRVGLILNFEARGASGPSLMFETGPGNAKLIDLFARAAPQPYANSLLYEIYRLMPNDTDFSVYRRAGYNGFNFAFTGSGALYHSERDNLANLNRDTFRHHGDNLFALADTLVDVDLDGLKSAADASYFDLFGTTMIVWSAALNLPLALLVLLAIAGLIAAHRAAFGFKPALAAVGALVAAPILLFALGWLLAFPLGIWPGVHPIDHANPLPARVALTAAGLLASLIVAMPLRRIDPRAVLLIIALAFGLAGAAVAWFITGAAYLLVFPALAFAAAAWVATMMRTGLGVAAWVLFALAAFFWLPFFPRLDLVLGFDLSQFKILALTPVVWTLVPLFASTKTRLPAAAAALAVAAASVVAVNTAPYAANHPRGLNIVYLDDRSATPRWLIDFEGGADEAYLKTTGFPVKDEAYKQLGLFDATGRLKPAADLKLEAPSLAIAEVAAEGPLTVLRGSLRPGRGGLQLGFAIAPGSGIRTIRIAGQDLIGAERLSRPTPALAGLSGWGAADIPIEIAFDPAAKSELILIERSKLPDGVEPQALRAARPRDAAPAHNGDAAVVAVKYDLVALGREAPPLGQPPGGGPSP